MAVGEPQVGEVNRLTTFTLWWGDPPHVTKPTWGPAPPCKQALKQKKTVT